VTASPSGVQYEIAHGDHRATVVSVGGGIRTLEAGGVPLVQGYDRDAVCDGARGQLLLPWPNRIDDAVYDFAGRRWQLAVTEVATGSAIHGLTRWANWRCVAHDDDRVTLAHRLHPQPGWPGVLDLTVDHALDDTGLTVTVTAHNVGAIAVPFGSGAHPYLVAGDGGVDDWIIEIPAATVAGSAVAGTDLDFRVARPIGTVVLDHPFTDLARDDDGVTRVRLRGPAGETVTLWADAGHRWLQVFTGDHLADPARRRSAVAVEPMTCPPNAFRTGEDLIVLEPDERVTLRWGITSR
jgi:aldose 1-epimerase